MGPGKAGTNKSRIAEGRRPPFGRGRGRGASHLSGREPRFFQKRAGREISRDFLSAAFHDDIRGNDAG